MQLMELDVPMVLALNMMDEVQTKWWICFGKSDGGASWNAGCSYFSGKRTKESRNW